MDVRTCYISREESCVICRTVHHVSVCIYAGNCVPAQTNASMRLDSMYHHCTLNEICNSPCKCKHIFRTDNSEHFNS